MSAGTLTADFVRFGRNAKGAVLIAMVAFFLGNSLMFIFGAAGAAAVGQADISDVMIAQGLLLPAIVVLGLNIWTTNDNALYALWLYNNFVGRLTFLSAAIPPIGGVIIAADHYIPGIVPVNAVLGGVFSYILLNPLSNRSLAKSPEVSHAEQ